VEFVLPPLLAATANDAHTGAEALFTVVSFHQYSPFRTVAALFTVTVLVRLANPYTEATAGVAMLEY
jgi:hypothetical protein